MAPSTKRLPVGLAPPLLLLTISLLAANSAGAQEQPDLAAQVQNPVANLISLPFQFNATFHQGADEETGYLLNIQPVIPARVSDSFNVVFRPIIPVASQPPFGPMGDRVDGLGDVVLQTYFTPSTPKGVIWGVGPAVTFPTATDEALGSDKWSGGPAFVLINQKSGWTSGALLLHQWSFAGDADRSDVSYTFLQPFFSKTSKTAWSLGMSADVTYNWEADHDEWLIPMRINVSKVTKWGRQPVSVGGSIGHRVVGPEAAGDWNARFSLTFLFPK